MGKKKTISYILVKEGRYYYPQGIKMIKFPNKRSRHTIDVIITWRRFVRYN